MTYQHALVIHRRDLRKEDNTALNAALASAERVSPCFIFDPRQVGAGNVYRSERAVAFMAHALAELAQSYRKDGGHLSVFEGEAHEVLTRIITENDIDAVYVNADYTPFAKARDEALAHVCHVRGVAFEICHDLLLVGDPADALNKSGEPYKVFTPFFRYATETFPVARPRTARGVFSRRSLERSDKSLLDTYVIVGGKSDLPPTQPRSVALTILDNISTLKTYPDTRDFPHLSTSRLSMHHKFGTISIRESYHAMQKALGAGHPLIRQLYWRDFFTQLSHHFPHVYDGSFDTKYDGVSWPGSDEAFARWCKGTTGFPIVDAGMRELNATGYMHNRARMIVASFLTKDLHIDWRLGEKYFTEQLIDYDPAVNNGSWQWAAGTGADAAPYFRIFNPWLQQKKFDPECVYIKEWVPELQNVAPSVIHAFDTKGVPEGVNYPAPMLDHKQEAAEAKRLYGEGIQ